VRFRRMGKRLTVNEAHIRTMNGERAQFITRLNKIENVIGDDMQFIARFNKIENITGRLIYERTVHDTRVNDIAQCFERINRVENTIGLVLLAHSQTKPRGGGSSLRLPDEHTLSQRLLVLENTVKRLLVDVGKREKHALSQRVLVLENTVKRLLVDAEKREKVVATRLAQLEVREMKALNERKELGALKEYVATLAGEFNSLMLNSQVKK